MNKVKKKNSLSRFYPDIFKELGENMDKIIIKSVQNHYKI